MKVTIGGLSFTARSCVGTTHGIGLIQFGPFFVDLRYLPGIGATVVEATPAERAELIAHGCPTEAIVPDTPNLQVHDDGEAVSAA